MADSTWPDSDSILIPWYFNQVKIRLATYQARYDALMEQDPAKELNMDSLLGSIGFGTFGALRTIASEAPKTLPVDIQTMNEMANQLAKSNSKGRLSGPLAEIDILPDKAWDTMFKDYCALWSNVIDTWLHWDSLFHIHPPADLTITQVAFNLVRQQVVQMKEYPCLTPWYKGLMLRVNFSRSGVKYNENLMEDLPEKKRKAPPYIRGIEDPTDKAQKTTGGDPPEKEESPTGWEWPELQVNKIRAAYTSK